MKRLVLFLDGTWNKADGSHPETNVVKLRDAVDRDPFHPDPQRVYYDEGVGTGGLIDKCIGGAFGRWRCSRRVEYRPLEERIQVSAVERMRAGGYRPRNLCDALARKGTDRLRFVDWNGETVRIDDDCGMLSS